MTHHSDLVDWLTKAFGVVRVEDAASYAELDNDLTGLGVKPFDRPELFAMARVIAQTGCTAEEAGEAIMQLSRAKCTRLQDLDLGGSHD